MTGCKNSSKFTDLLMMATLPEFFQISRISQENYKFLEDFPGVRSKFQVFSRTLGIQEDLGILIEL